MRHAHEKNFIIEIGEEEREILLDILERGSSTTYWQTPRDDQHAFDRVRAVRDDLIFRLERAEPLAKRRASA